MVASDDPGFLAIDGDLDATSLITTRREQRKLRQTLLAGLATAECSLCARNLPIDCVRTAHIKKRSKCTETERRSVSNIMRACTLGCDHLFELGYVYVDQTGIIKRRSNGTLTPDLEQAISRIEGSACAAHDVASEPFFEWHRSNL